MTVRCSGDCQLIEATWEKQDFEAEITRQRFSHDDFTISVQRVATRGPYGLRYIVTVKNIVTHCDIAYRGGNREAWVRRFAVDLAKGAFGQSSGTPART